MSDDARQIVIVRHGETEWSASGRHTSRTDLPLTPRGEEQADEVGRVLRNRRFHLVLSSPRRRALDTARIVGFPGAESDVDLVEWDYGAYEGLTTAEISTATGRPWSLWRDGIQPTPEGTGEQAADLMKRNQPVTGRALDVLDSGGDVLLFSHGHYLRTLAATWIGCPVDFGEHLVLDTAAICVLGFEHGRPVIRQWNRPPWREAHR